MTIKINRKEVLKIFKWRTRRKLKKHEKRKKKDPKYKKNWDNLTDDIDRFLAGGLE